MIFQIEVKYTFSRNSRLKCPIAPFRTSSFEEISHFFNALQTWNQARQIRYLTRGVNKLSLEDNVAPLVFHANTGGMRKKMFPPFFHICKNTIATSSLGEIFLPLSLYFFPHPSFSKTYLEEQKFLPKQCKQHWRKVVIKRVLKEGGGVELLRMFRVFQGCGWKQRALSHLQFPTASSARITDRTMMNASLAFAGNNYHPCDLSKWFFN